MCFKSLRILISPALNSSKIFKIIYFSHNLHVVITYGARTKNKLQNLNMFRSGFNNNTNFYYSMTVLTFNHNF